MPWAQPGDAPVGATIGEVLPSEGFGEHALLTGKPRHTKTLTCASRECEVVEILGEDFLRLVEKSRVVRQSFERLNSRRSAHNERVMREQTAPPSSK